MRSETEVFAQITTFLRENESIRAAVLNGSRANPNAPRDLFQDYDVACYTPEPVRFLRDQGWMARFGERVIVQQNDFEVDGQAAYIFLMLFMDGVRIDLSFHPLAGLAHLAEDSLTVVLLDKDGRIGPLAPASDAGYWVARPRRKEFDETVNEIFWCSNNVAKGLWRGETAYVQAMLEEIIRPPVMKLLSWYAAMLHGWQVCTGKFGKWLPRYLPEEVWQAYAATYVRGSSEETWEALLALLRLTRQAGQEVAAHLGYTYPLEDDRRMNAYLCQTRGLAKDAVDFGVVRLKV